MNTLLRHAALALAGLLLAVPIITFHGSVHLLLLLACVFLLGRKLFEPGIWPLCALGVYTLFIGAFYVRGFDDWKEINSQQMRQLSVMLLVFYAMRRATLHELHLFLAGVLLVAVVGVLGEMRGLNMQDLLPAQFAPQGFASEVGFLNTGEQRFHSFYSESSILLGATTAYAFMAAVGTIAVWRHLSGRGFLAASAGFCALCMLFLLGVTLAKTGLVLAVGGGLGYVLALLIYSPRKHVLRLLGCATAVALLLACTFAVLPGSMRDYFINDLRSLPGALEGNSKLEATTSGGLLTRVECWRIAFDTLWYHPLGVGLFGISDVISDTNHISLTAELRYLFGLDIFGLKNALANVVAQTGIPGTLLLGLAFWQSFIRPLRMAARRGDPLCYGTAGVYLSACFIAFLFVATCETYYWLAFPIVLKCYADAVARERQEAVARERQEADTAWRGEDDFARSDANPEFAQPITV